MCTVDRDTICFISQNLLFSGDYPENTGLNVMEKKDDEYEYDGNGTFVPHDMDL